MKEGVGSMSRQNEDVGVFVSYLEKLLCLIVLFVLCAFPVLAQSPNSQISGIVEDASGAVVPDTDVVALNTDTGIAYSSVTNDSGLYVIPEMRPGPYKITVSKQGFSTSEKSGLVLQTGDRISLNFTLKVASVGQNVVVQEEVAPITLSAEQTSDSTTLDNKMITELPQLDRSTLELTSVTPAVQGQGPLSDNVQSLGTSAYLLANHGTSFSVAGGQVNGTTISVDGNLVQDMEYNTPNRSIPTPDSISEFRVESGVLTADHGRYSGGIISINTQSGTNEYHGRLFEYFRNQAMNANNWYNNANGVPIEAFHQNNYGLGIGGPLSIPKLYNAKNKTFFYFGWEGQRFSQGQLTQNSVPTALNQQGNFSQTIINYQNGQPVYATLYDPFHGYLDNGNWVRYQYPNATIPAPGTCVNGLDAEGNATGPCLTTQSTLFAHYMALYPSPNHAPATNTDHINNYWQTIKLGLPTDRFFFRVDHNLTSNQRLSANVSEAMMTDSYPSPGSGLAQSLTTDRDWSGSLLYTWVINPRSILDVHIGVGTARLYSDGISGLGMPADPNIDTSTWGFDPLLVNNPEKDTVHIPPGIQIPGYSNIGGSEFDTFVNQTTNGSVSFTRVIDRHTIKAGFELYFYRFNENGGDHTGVAWLNAGGGSNEFWNNNDGLSGNSLAELMMGSSSFFQWGNWNITPFGWNEAGFVTDDWKVSNKLTIQMGLRWDHDGGREARRPQASTPLAYDPNVQHVLNPNSGWDWSQVTSSVPGLASLGLPQWLNSPAGASGQTVLLNSPEYPQKNIYSTDWMDFQPRLGIAYAFDPKTTFRAGAGISYQGLGGLSTDYFSFYYNSVTFQQKPTLDGFTWISSIANPFPVQSNGLPLGYYAPISTNAEYSYQTFGQSANPNQGGASLLTHQNSPEEYTWQLSIQRELTKNWVFTADYTGIRGIHLLMPVWGWSPNNIPLQYYSLGSQLETPVPNPFYNQSQTFASEPTVPLYQLLGGSPQYTALSPGQATWGKSFSNFITFQAQTRNYHGFTLLASYAIRKTLTNTGGKDIQHGGPVGSGLLQDPHNLMEGYGLALYELPQTLLLNYSYDLPFGHGRQFLSGGSGWSQKLIDGFLGGWAVAGVSTWYPKGTPVLMPDVNGGVTAPGAAIRWSLAPGTNYLNPNANYSQGIILNGAFTNPNPQGIFNSAAFARTPDYGFSNAAFVFPNVRNPGAFYTDATILKKFYFPKYESLNLEFRAEAQNIFNHPNFGAIDNNPDDPTFGGVQGKSGNRIMQLGLRLFF